MLSNMRPKTYVIRFFHWLLLLLVTGVVACSKEAPLPEQQEEEDPYVERPNGARLFSGYNRLLITWKQTNPLITGALVYWNNRSDSLLYTIPAGTDSVKILLNNLEEGEYQLELYTLDKDRHRSGKVMLSGYVYGDQYASTLTPRRLSDIIYTKDERLRLIWAPKSEGSAIGAEVAYQDREGKTRQIRLVTGNESESEIPDIHSGLRGSIRYRTIYAPGEKVIDTLFSDYLSQSYVNRYAVYDSLPGWAFRCKVMVEEQTIADHGGMIPFKEKMDEAIARASKKFQVAGLNDEGNNQIHFYATEILSFSGRSSQFTIKQWVNDASLDLMLVVNDHAADDDDSWGWRRAPYLTLGHDYQGIFGSNAVDALLHEFGHTRGMYDLYLGEVTAARNPVSHQAYESDRCIMNYPYGETVWSEFAQIIINASGDERVARHYWDFFPDAFWVKVKRKDQTPAVGAKLRFFPVIQTSSGNVVRENDVIQYRTTLDDEGSYLFDPPNPFAIDQIPNRNIYNFLVEVSYSVAGSHYTDYAWMPMNDALTAGSRGIPYELKIILSN